MYIYIYIHIFIYIHIYKPNFGIAKINLTKTMFWGPWGTKFCKTISSFIKVYYKYIQ